MFASAREAAGTGSTTIDAGTVGELLERARRELGPAFAEVLDTSKVWLDGEPADDSDPIGPESEVAVLPPVSGG